MPIENIKSSLISCDSKQEYKKTIEIETNPSTHNFDQNYANNTHYNQLANDIMRKNNDFNKGNSSGRRPRPNTANFFKLKQNQNINRNGFMSHIRNNPLHLNTVKSITKKENNVQTPKDQIKLTGNSLGTD